jgi:hypothetical protein
MTLTLTPFEVDLYVPSTVRTSRTGSQLACSKIPQCKHSVCYKP